MARPCSECVDPEVTGCQCSFDNSDSILVPGAGTPGDPFIPEANIDPDAGNRLEVSASGLLVPTYPYVYAYAADDQNRADGEPIAFNANDAHVGTSTIHDPADPAGKYDFTITETGWWEGWAQTLVRDTNPLTSLNLYWEDDGGAGSRYSEGWLTATPGIVWTKLAGWFTASTVLEVRLRFTGAGPADVQGGTRYRTFAYLRKVAKV